MSPRFVGLTVLLSLSASAQDFQTANRQLQEQSFSKACDSFTAVIKADPSNREALAKRLASCIRVGKASTSDLQKFATEGEKDFARAWAAAFMATMGYGTFEQALPLLKQAATGSGREATEARQLIVAGAFQDIDRNSYTYSHVESRAALIAEYSTSPNEKAKARYQLAVCGVNDPKHMAASEKELADVGKGSTDWADDALYVLGSRRENMGKFTEALEIYDSVVTRFSDTTSNMKSSARSRADEIRRPIVSVNIGSFELQGVKPKVQMNWRNQQNVSLTLKRANPMNPGESPPTSADQLWSFATETVKAWQLPLEVPVPYAPGSKTFDLEVNTPGVYVLEAVAGQQTSRTFVLVTQTVTLTKTDQNHLLVWVSDVETGATQPNAEVTVWQSVKGRWQRTAGKTDADGLATFPSLGQNESQFVWTRSGAHFSFAQAGRWYSPSYSKQELAYIMTDRPLYKPGETVGIKVFLRGRDSGPTTPITGRTVELNIVDPTGKVVANPSITTNAFGTASYTFEAPKKGTLGAWFLRIQQNGVYYQQQQYSFRLEEYKPPEATVSVEPIGNPKPGDVVKFKVKASYFSGGPVPNAGGRAIITVTYWNHQWAAWPDDKSPDQTDDGNDGDEYEERGYRRGYPGGYYGGYYGQLASHTVVFKTGADGTAEVEVPKTELQGATSVEYRVNALVTDSSRREIQGSGSVKVTSVAFFADLRSDHYLYKPGEKVGIRLRAEDANGRPSTPELIVRLKRIAEDGSTSKIAETRTKLVKGVGLVQLDADALGMVRAEVVDAATPEGAVLAQTDLWLTSDTKPMVPTGAAFSLYVDRAPLKVGQTIRALVVTPRPGGHVLLSLENEAMQGSRVIEMKGRARFVELPLSATLAPNAWLLMHRFENARQYQQQRPIKVTGSDVELGVNVSLGNPVVEPGAQLTAKVDVTSAPPGSPLEMAMTVVDQSLFSIEPERTDFLAFFGKAQRQLSVHTETTMSMRRYNPRPVVAVDTKPPTAQRSNEGDSRHATKDDARESKKTMALDDLSGAAAGPRPAAAPSPMAEEASADAPARSEKAAMAKPSPVVTGGGNAAEAPVKIRTNFGTSSGWFAALAGKAGTPLSQSLTLTDSLTSWKAVATVVSQGPQIGRGSATVRTAKPLMVRLQAPRFFIENDEVTLSAVIESHLAKATDIEVSITSPGMKELTPTRKTVKVDPEGIVRFDARFKVSALGDNVVRAIVKGGGASDAMEWKLPALVHGSAQRQFFAGRMTDTFSFEFEVPEKRKPSLTKFELVLSPSLLSVMLDGLPYLAQYPYGCVEQTLSRFVPAAIARRTVKELNLPANRVPADLDNMIADGLSRLMTFQHSDGGWGWWQTDTTNKWMTAYVVYALSLAKEAGVSVDQGSLDRGRDYLISHLGEGLNDPETHVFMTYALSSIGKAPAAALNADFDRRTSLSPRGRALVALSLLNAKSPKARIAVENLDDIVKAAQSRKDAAVGDANDVWSTSAAIEATSLTLMAMIRYDVKSPMIQPLTDFLVLRRNGGKFRTTRDTAFALYALSELAKKEAQATKAGSFVVFVNGREVKRLKFSQGGLDLEPLVLPDNAFKGGKNVIEVKRDGAGTGYYAGTIDVFNQNSFIKGVGGDVKIKRTYTLLGKPSNAPSAAETEFGMPVESGTRVRVDVDVTANKAVEFVMVEDLKPAGFEAVMVRSGPEVCNFACAHAELRTDRVAMFLSQLPVGTTRVSYELRAEVPGKFSALPARFEAMYAPEIQATSDEMRLEVRDEPVGNAVRP